MKKNLLRLFALLLLSTQALAGGGESPDLFTRYEHYYVSHTLNADGSGTVSQDWALKVLKEGAVANAKQASISYSTSIQKAEVLEAYTRKADGRRIDAPKDNFQLEVNGGKGKDAPVFSDWTTLTVVFPEVAVGDTVVFSYKITQAEPIFPGQFSTSASFSGDAAYDDVRIRIEAPSSLWAQHDARGMKESIRKENDRTIIEWTYQNPQPVRNKRRDYSVFDVEQETGFAYSTFKSYAEIALAYGARALPKAAVTDRISKLADEIAADRKTPREIAKALYDWVATNISYAGNCIGVGAVVPHDTSFILDNRMGDCKDHATLLQALLAAKGIDSTQALINSGNTYRLPRIPHVATVNHVINYIPSLNLYLDSTSNVTPFGMLPFGSADKPVLLVDGFREGARTPPFAAESNRQRINSTLAVKPDGSLSGTVEVDLKGVYAANARAGLRHISKDQEDDLVKNVAKSNGYIGSGTFTKDDPAELLDTYKYKANIRIDDFIQRPGAGAFHVLPLFSSEAPIQSFLGAATDAEETVDTACYGGHSIEQYRFRFPQGMTILYVPDDLAVSNDFLSYRASYRMQGNTLLVKRSLDDNTSGNVCSPAVSKAYKKLALKILQNVKSQVLYKYK